MKYYSLVSRSLIALLFVVAGINKLNGFENTTGYFGSLGIPMPLLAAIIAIIVEIPVALAFAWGWKVRVTGYILIAFTVLATLFGHKDMFGAEMVTVLKNLAIIGGIMSAIACTCDDCVVHKKK